MRAHAAHLLTSPTLLRAADNADNGAGGDANASVAPADTLSRLLPSLAGWRYGGEMAIDRSAGAPGIAFSPGRSRGASPGGGAA